MGFCYNLFMVYLDLAELDIIFRGNPFWSVGRPNIAWLCRTDHLGDPHVPLEQAGAGFGGRKKPVADLWGPFAC